MIKTLALLSVAATAGGCKKIDESKVADKASCAAIARSIRVNNILIPGVTQYLSDAERTAVKAQRWTRKEVTDAENGTGEFSGAMNRMLQYAGSAVSLCGAVRQIHSGIESIAQTIHEPSVHLDERILNLECFDQLMVGDPSANVGVEWKNIRAAVQLAESRYLDACTATFGADDGRVDGWPLGYLHELATARSKEQRL